jgi:hypothetical protein
MSIFLSLPEAVAVVVKAVAVPAQVDIEHLLEHQVEDLALNQLYYLAKLLTR